MGNSYLLILLLFIALTRFIYSHKIRKGTSIYWRKILTLMVITLWMFFVTHSFVIFYVYFELSVLPIFIIIMGWGYQSERLGARLSLIFYTISASVPFLIFILLSINNQKMYFFFSSIPEVNNFRVSVIKTGGICFSSYLAPSDLQFTFKHYY